MEKKEFRNANFKVFKDWNGRKRTKVQFLEVWGLNMKIKNKIELKLVNGQ
jgi:hypothetical protein